MNLNKKNVLDNGFVSLLSSSNTDNIINDVQDQYYKGSFYKNLAKITQATFIIKCPIFVHLYLSRFNLTILTTPTTKVEAYVPDVSEISANKLEESNLIRDNMEATTQALLINPKAFQYDGCNNYISQVMTPISVYSNLIVNGSILDWIEFLNKKGKLPSPIEQYRLAVEEFLKAEWKDLNEYY